LADVQSRLERFQREQKALLRSWEHRTDEEDVDRIHDTISQQEYEALVAEKKGWAEGWRRRGVTEGTVATVVAVVTESVASITDELGKAEAEQLRILEDKPNAPGKTVVGSVEDLKKQLADLGSVDESKLPELESIVATYPGQTDRWIRLTTDIKDLKQQIKDYEAMPFNPECASCRSQPYKKREQEDRAKLVKFQEERKQLQTQLSELADIYGDLEDVKGTLKDLKQKVRDRDELFVAIAFRMWQTRASQVADRVKQLRFQKEQAILSERVTQFKAEQAVWDEKVMVGGLAWSRGVKAGLALAVAEAEAWEAWTVADAAQSLRVAEKRHSDVIG
jgi:myosin heavy subunit